jgi:hypothetical protein
LKGSQSAASATCDPGLGGSFRRNGPSDPE